MHRTLPASLPASLLLLLASCILFTSLSTRAEESPPVPVESAPPESQDPPELIAARERARLMHDIYASTLDVMHRRYFHGEKEVVPARAMEDVFAQMKRKTRVDARWISVNMPPMSINHEPETEFEKLAAAEIADGKDAFEIVEEGTYRRATPILLTAGCVGCHGGVLRQPPQGPKFAGLIISFPLTPKK